MTGPEKFIGAASDDPGSNGHANNYLCLTRYQAEASGNVVEIKVKLKSGTSCNVKLAIYADSSGAPGNLLNSTSGHACTEGWNTISISSTAITSGTYYWLAVMMDGYDMVMYNTSGTMRYKAYAFANAWPDPAGAGYSSGAYHSAIAGWGSTVPPTAPDPPTLVSPGTAITFKWNASSGATKYHLQVNTLANFTGTDLFNAELGDVASREVTGLSLGTTYYWRVKAGNDGGWSDWSSVSSVLAAEVP